MEYIDDDDSSELNFQNIIKILEKLKIKENKSILLNFLNIISNVSKNCHRTPDIFNKIEKILLYIFNSIYSDQVLSNSEIFDIFKDDKLVLLLLLNKKILEINQNNINEFDKYFFYPELKEKISTEYSDHIEKQLLKHDPNVFVNFDEKRKIGENDSQICFLIRNDLVIDFISYINKSNISINSYISESIFETNSFLLSHDKTSLIEYAAFFGSFQIFQYLLINKADVGTSLWLYAVHGRNPDLIHLIERNDIKPINIYFDEVFIEAAKCHFNEIAEYIQNQKETTTLCIDRINAILHLGIYSVKNDQNEFYEASNMIMTSNMASEIYKSGNYKYFPNNITSIMNNNGYGLPIQILCSPYKKITIPDISEIPFKSFCECSMLQEVIIPSSVTVIEANAFMKCQCLKKVSIPSSVYIIEGGVFQDCEGLEEITIPPSVRSINDSTFKGCKNLKEIKILSLLKTIGNFAFCECESLVEIKIPSSVKSIGERAFENCKSLKNILIPSLVTKIGKKCFDKCKSLTQVLINSPLKTIESGTFQRCTNLNEILLPPTLITIGDYAFRDCSSLVNIIIPDSVTSIGFCVFYNCLSLKEITIPYLVTEIGEYAFDKCSSLMKILIPSSLTSIGNNAFPLSVEVIKY